MTGHPTHTAAARGWLRRNRWWLIALPLALAVALASAAYRVNDFWWENGWHRADATVDQGTFVTTRATVYSFDDKPRRVGLRVRLGEVTRTGEMRNPLGEALPLPPSATGVRLRLDFEAVKGKPAPYCTVYVVDTGGSRYEAQPLDSGSNPCPPPGGSPEDSSAPKTWSRIVAAAVPKRAKVEYVWVGVSWPDYVRFRISPSRRAIDLPHDAR
ncbi:MAG TPA: hypothetical protein VM093_03370 [Aeromicrobium sp.]|nr:hypothetical protein [Aeromicrobium sp.]